MDIRSYGLTKDVNQVTQIIGAVSKLLHVMKVAAALNVYQRIHTSLSNAATSQLDAPIFWMQHAERGLLAVKGWFVVAVCGVGTS
jgi:hypothetical protein